MNRDTQGIGQCKKVRIIRGLHGSARVMLLKDFTSPIPLCDAERVQRDGEYVRIYTNSPLADFYVRADLIEWCDYNPLATMED